MIEDLGGAFVRLIASSHLQPLYSIASDVSLPSDTFRAPERSVTEGLGQNQTQALQQ